MKAFITGISGFAGKHLASYLLEQGYEVYGIDRNSTEINGCRVEVCDILEYGKLHGVIESSKPDVIFHLAAFSSVRKSFANADLTKKISVEGTKNLLDAVIACKISPVILVVSSLQVYGKPDKLPITESAKLRPASPYAESKVEQEKMCMDYFKTHKLKIIIVRSFNHTGPSQSAEFVWPSFAKQIAESEAGKS